jgi:hypothetical protein
VGGVFRVTTTDIAPKLDSRSGSGSMTLRVANKQGDRLDDVTRFCDETLDHSIHAFLHRERDPLLLTKPSLICAATRLGVSLCRRRGHSAPTPRRAL